MLQTLVGRLAGVGEALHRTHLLTQTTLGRTLKNTFNTQTEDQCHGFILYVAGRPLSSSLA